MDRDPSFGSKKNTGMFPDFKDGQDFAAVPLVKIGATNPRKASQFTNGERRTKLTGNHPPIQAQDLSPKTAST